MDPILDRWTARPSARLAAWALVSMMLAGCGRTTSDGLLQQAELLKEGAADALASTPISVPVPSGDVLVVTASQADVDVVLELRDAGDRVLATSAGPAGMRGRELLVWRADVSAAGRASPPPQVHLRVVGTDRPPTGRVRLAKAVVPATAPPAMLAVLQDAALAMGGRQSIGAAERARLFERLEQRWRELDERELAAEAALQLAALRYVDLEQWREAHEAATRAAGVLRDRGAAKEYADATLLRGIAVSELARARGKPEKEALAAILEARREYQALRLPVAAAEALNFAGMAQFYQSDVAAAVKSFAAAADEFGRAAASKPRRMVLQNLAVVQLDRGEYRAAADAYAALLADWPDADGHARAAVLQNASVAASYLGDYERALSWYLQSLDAARAISSLDLEARALQGLGRIHLLLGQPQLAIEHLREALRLFDRLGDRMPQVYARNELGDALLAAGDRDAALREQRVALRLLGEGGFAEARGRVLVSLGTAEAAFGRQQQAAALFGAALSAELPTASGVALRARYGRAQAWALLGRRPEARAELDALVTTAQAEFLPDHEALALGLRAQVRRDTGDLPGALSDSAAALAALERLTAGTANRDNRVTLARRARELLELRVDLLAGSGDALAALQAVDRYGVRGAWTAVTAAEVAVPDGALEEVLAQRRYRLEAMTERGQPDADRLAALQAEIAVLRSRLAEQRRSARVADVASPADMTLLAATLPEDATVLVYALGRERGWLWQLSRDGVVLHRLPAADAVDALVGHLLLRIGQLRDVEPELLRLRRMLLPLDAAALAGRRLFVVPDGSLAAMPWALLKRPTEAAAVQQVARVSDLLRAPAERHAAAAIRRAALFGDPLFGPDPRGFAPLPGSRRELERVRARLGPAQVQVYTGAAASRAALLALPGVDLDVLHLATHAYLDGYAPELSALVLSQRDAAGRRISGDVRAGDLLRWPRAPRLVVLSACDAASEPSRQAPGLLSLTRALHARGTEHVVASLWPVADAAAAALMDAFYAALVEDGLAPDRALTVAQRKLEQSPQWKAPFFWAGFVVIGAGP